MASDTDVPQFPEQKVFDFAVEPIPKKPEISDFTDFREYLKAFYQFKRKTQSTPVRQYNYSTFSASADIKSPNYLKLIIDGQRNLSPDMIKKFAKALQLNKVEEEEFQALVNYGQAKDPLERNRKLKTLSDLRVQRGFKEGTLKEEPWEKVPNWVAWVLYALTDQKNSQFDIQSLRQLMRGRASLDEIRKSLEALVQGGELVQDPTTGQILKGRKLMQGSGEIPTELIRKLQAELIYLGLESLFQDHSNDREFGALTICLTKEEFEQVRFELRQLKKRILKDVMMNREQSKGDRVYQFNLQFFPLTDEAPE